MPSKIDARLQELNITLPVAVAPSANYVPALVSKNFLYISGQVPKQDGKDYFVGKLGQEFGIEEGQQAARLCALNVLAHAKLALDGNLDRIVRCVRLGGFVNATADFGDHPQVINGASNLIVDVLGDAGKHARAAVGVNSLPRGVAVEVEAVFEIE
jgi:enamine deaminase RidA (YjgF/YER057c/UK114 family)